MSLRVHGFVCPAYASEAHQNSQPCHGTNLPQELMQAVQFAASKLRGFGFCPSQCRNPLCTEKSQIPTALGSTLFSKRQGIESSNLFIRTG